MLLVVRADNSYAGGEKFLCALSAGRLKGGSYIRRRGYLSGLLQIEPGNPSLTSSAAALKPSTAGGCSISMPEPEPWVLKR